MSPVRQILVGALKRVYRRAEKIALETWAARNIIIPQKESIDNSGPYSPDQSFYVVRLLDEFMKNPAWRTMAVMKSSQCGMTLHVLIVIARILAEAATNIMYVIDTREKARELSKKRMKPLLESCRALALDMKENEDELNNLSYNLPTCSIGLRGSGTAGQVASDPIGFAIGDEVDKWPDQKKESHIWDLLVNRIKRAEFGKAIGFSSPTIESGKINELFKAGSQHRNFVPCPHCGEYQYLTWDRVRYQHCKDLTGHLDPRQVLTDTYYECSKCNQRIDEDHKPAMSAACQPRPTNYRIETIDGITKQIPQWLPGEMSAHVDDLMSLHPQSTWGKLALEWISAQGKPSKIQDFYNGRLGQPVKQNETNITDRHIWRLCGKYKKGTLPIIPAAAVMAVDNQGNHQKYVRAAFDDNGDLYVVDWGKTLALEETDNIAAIPIPRPEGESIVQKTIIDEGGKGGTSYAVRKFCLPRFPSVFPCKGRGGIQVKNTIAWSKSYVDRGGVDSIDVCHFDDDGFKQELYTKRIKEHDPEKSRVYGIPRLYLPRNIDEEFVRELCGEQLVKTLNKEGVEEFVWEASPPNDYGDCIKMLYVLWNIIGAQLQAK